VRFLFTTGEARDWGLSQQAIRCGTRAQRFRSIGRGVYGEGAEDPSALDWARADVLRRHVEARGSLAGVLHELDSVVLDQRRTRRERLSAERLVIVAGQPCADGLSTLIDLAATLDDLRWEHALESALRKGLTSVPMIEDELPCLGAARVPGTARIRRVLALRPAGAPPTESLLETLMVQLARDVPEVGEFERQHVVLDEHGIFVARLDLARPQIEFFVELDGQQHKDQPVYDAMRETAVVAVTGWLPGRFTWTELTRYPSTTKRRLAGVATQARRRARGAR
jgi:very-short-patch-repair endonuclease